MIAKAKTEKLLVILKLLPIFPKKSNNALQNVLLQRIFLSKKYVSRVMMHAMIMGKF